MHDSFYIKTIRFFIILARQWDQSLKNIGIGKDHAVEYGNTYIGRRWMYECIDVNYLEYLDIVCNYCKVLFNVLI
jgi:hypothetical protein